MTNIELLEEAIAILDTAFEDGSDCVLPDDIASGLGLDSVVVSDPTYDMLRNRLKEARPDSEVFATVTASNLERQGTKIRHDPPMTSIAKASHEDRSMQQAMLDKWSKDASVVSKDFYQSYKLDGCALALYYENGRLAKAGLRPRNGRDGEDVTEQVKYVRGVPVSLNVPVTCSVRGELICYKSDFEIVQNELREAGEAVRANPRNHAAGGIRQFKNPSKVKDMRLSFIAHSVVGLANPPFRTEIERAEYCNKVLGIEHVPCYKFSPSLLEDMEKQAKGLDYMVDGVVIGVNNLLAQEELGTSGGSDTGTPNGKIAWKFAEEKAFPTIKEIEWNTGRTGSVTPVAIFDPVPLAGTMVSRVTLHNLGFMSRREIGLGTKIIVLKAGSIIPKVVGVVSGKKKPEHPTECPSCGHKLNVDTNKEMLDLVCPDSACPAQNVNSLCHFLDVIGVVGLGESKVSQLVQSGVVKDRSDFFSMTVKDAMKSGLSERQSVLAVAAVWMIPNADKIKDSTELLSNIKSVQKDKLKIPAWQIFASFGIESSGKSCGKALIEHFLTFDKIREATVQELSKVTDVGEKTAGLVVEWLKEHRKEIDRLFKYIDPVLPVQGNLTGKTFCLSGGFPEGKRKWEKEIEDRGGKVKGISKSTTVLVQGSDPGADKEEKAKKYGVRILSFEKFKAEFL